MSKKVNLLNPLLGTSWMWRYFREDIIGKFNNRKVRNIILLYFLHCEYFTPLGVWFCRLADLAVNTANVINHIAGWERVILILVLMDNGFGRGNFAISKYRRIFRFNTCFTPCFAIQRLHDILAKIYVPANKSPSPVFIFHQ
jgi:hypothetical protein